MTYDGNLLGSHAANMATYALYVQVIFLLNNFHQELKTPLDVFYKYFDWFREFDWDRQMLSVYGPINTLNVCDRSKNLNEIDIEIMALNEREKHDDLKTRPLLFTPD